MQKNDLLVTILDLDIRQECLKISTWIMVLDSSEGFLGRLRFFEYFFQFFDNFDSSNIGGKGLCSPQTPSII